MSLKTVATNNTLTFIVAVYIDILGSVPTCYILISGMLFYKGQRSNGKGDYVTLNLADGYLHFKYNLGSGASDIK